MTIDASAFAGDAVAEETAAFNAAAIAAAAAAPLPESIDALRAVVVESYAAMQGGTIHHSDRARTEQAGMDGPPVRIIDAPSPAGVYVYFHGGGWTVGRSDIQDRMLERLADATGLTVVSVAYRLAPEHPFPAPLDDCEAAARWAASQGFSRLALGGESAGANLALAVALRLRDRPAALPVDALNLLYGAYDLSLTPSAAAYGTVGTLTTPALEMFYGCYAPPGVDRRHPEISPLFADLRGLPPALLTVGTADPLIDDSLFLHARLLAAGVTSELRVHPGGMHMFDIAPLPIAEAANAAIAAFLAPRDGEAPRAGAAARNGGDAAPARNGDDSVSARSGGDAAPARSGGAGVSARSGGDAAPARSGGASVSARSGGDAAPARNGDDSVSARSGGDAAPARNGDDSVSARSGGDAAPARNGDDSVSARSGGDAAPARGGEAVPA